MGSGGWQRLVAAEAGKPREKPGNSFIMNIWTSITDQRRKKWIDILGARQEPST
jgi:hypothetical protein